MRQTNVTARHRALLDIAVFVEILWASLLTLFSIIVVSTVDSKFSNIKYHMEWWMNDLTDGLLRFMQFSIGWHLARLWPACGSDLANRSGAPKFNHFTIIPDQIHVSGTILLSGISDCVSLNIDTISAILDTPVWHDKTHSPKTLANDMLYADEAQQHVWVILSTILLL